MIIETQPQTRYGMMIGKMATTGLSSGNQEQGLVLK